MRTDEFHAGANWAYLEDFRGYVRQEPVETLERVAKRADWPPERCRGQLWMC